jgi:hypothetical protein
MKVGPPKAKKEAELQQLLKEAAEKHARLTFFVRRRGVYKGARESVQHGTASVAEAEEEIKEHLELYEEPSGVTPDGE